MNSAKFLVQTANRYSSFLDTDNESDDGITKLAVKKAASKKNKKKSKKNGKLAGKKNEVKQDKNVVDTMLEAQAIENANTDVGRILNVETVTKAMDINQNIEIDNNMLPLASSPICDEPTPADNTVSWFDMCEEDSCSEEENDNEMETIGQPVEIMQQEQVQEQSANIASGMLSVDVRDVSIETNSNEASQRSVHDDYDETNSVNSQEWAWQPTRHFHNQQRNALRQQQKQQQQQQYHDINMKRNNLVQMQNYGRNGIEWHNQKQQRSRQQQRRHSTEVNQNQYQSRDYRHDKGIIVRGQQHQPASIASRQNHHHQHQLQSSTQSMKNRQRNGDNGFASASHSSRDSHVSTRQQQQQQHQQWQSLPPPQQQQQKVAKYQRFGNGANNGSDNSCSTNGRLGTNSWRAKGDAHGTDVVAQQKMPASPSPYVTVIDNNWRNYRATVKNF